MRRIISSAKIICTFLLLQFLITNVATAQTQSQRCATINAIITNGSIVNLCVGGSTTLNSKPATGGYTYQWQQQLGPGAFSNISGANLPDYTTSSTGAYRVVINNGPCVDTSAITNVVSLIISGGTISSNLSSNIVCVGSTGGTLSSAPVPGDGTNIITYQWQIKYGAGAWNDVAGANTASYTTPGIYGPTSFRRSVADNCGNIVYSNELSFDIFNNIDAGTIAPVTQTIPNNTAPSLLTSTTAASGGGVISYRWQSSIYPFGFWQDIPATNSLTYQPGALTITTYFRRLAVDVSCGGSTTPSNVIEVIVLNSPLVPGNLILNSNCTFIGELPGLIGTSYPPTGGTAPYTIGWQTSTDGVNYTDISGASGGTYQSGALSQSTYFRKKVTDAASTVEYTDPVFINLVTTPLSAGTIAVSSNIACLSSTPDIIKSTGGASGAGLNVYYQWEKRTVSTSWVAISGAIGGDYQPDPITEKTYYHRLVYDNCGLNTTRSATSNEVEIDVRQELLAGNIDPNTQSVLSGSTPLVLNNLISPSGGTGSYTLSWEKSPNGFGPWTTIPGETGLSYQPPAITQTTYYRRATKDNNCLAVKYTYVVEAFVITPVAIDGGDLIILSGCVFPGQNPSRIQPGSTPPSGGTAPYTYSWEMQSTSAPTWVVIPGATLDYYDPTPITETHIYRRKVTDALGNSAYSNGPITITYVTALLYPGQIGAAVTSVCPGNSPGIINSIYAASTTTVDLRYQWQQSLDGIVWTDIPGAILGYYTPGPLTATTYFRRLASDRCGYIWRDLPSNEVIINVGSTTRIAGGTISTTQIGCLSVNTSPGLLIGTVATGGTGNYAYQWEMKIGNGSWSIISGATGINYTPGNITYTTSFRRNATDIGCSGSAYSNTLTFNVQWTKLLAGLIDGPFITCSGTAPGTITSVLDACGGGGTLNYSWQYNVGLGWNTIPGANGASYTPNAINSTTIYRRMIADACGNTESSNEVTIYVYPTMEAGLIGPFEQTTCTTETPSKLELLTDCHYTDGTVSYQWQEATNTSGPWTDIAGEITPIYQPSASALTRYFRLKVSSTRCSMVVYTNTASIITNLSCRTITPNSLYVQTNGNTVKLEITKNENKSITATAENIIGITISPNPVTNNQFYVTANKAGSYQLSLVSVDGNKINFSSQKINDDKYFVTIKQQLAKGSYVLQMFDGAKHYTAKLIIQ